MAIREVKIAMGSTVCKVRLVIGWMVKMPVEDGVSGKNAYREDSEDDNGEVGVTNSDGEVGVGGENEEVGNNAHVFYMQGLRVIKEGVVSE